MRSLSPLFLVPTALAFQLPFKVPGFFSSSPDTAAARPDAVPANAAKIAIVGAGAAGSSAAFWLSKAKERFGIDVDVDVYDRNNYIGGRSTIVHPYDDKSLPELELGASIFVRANKNLWRAAEEFNLTLHDFSGENSETAIWDGEQFILNYSGSWWDTFKLVWRYGYLSPKRTEAIIQRLIKGLNVVYTPNTPKWDSIDSLVKTLGWLDDVNSTTADAFKRQGISERYIFELIEAATRVNYGQNADVIHAIEGACSMAASGASGIAGGNFQLFEQFLTRSQANVRLGTTVQSILPKQDKWTVRTNQGSKDYQAVIIAAPYHQTDISLPPAIAETIPEQPYVHLHVTLLTTNASSPNPEYFGFPASSPVPRTILTSYQGVRERQGKAPEFNSLTYHGLVREGEWAVKIFSEQEITDEWLEQIFPGQVKWVLRKLWQSYPHLPPTDSFPPTKLAKGLYYVNAFEPFISTMETETVASRGVVELLLNEQFNVGLCERLSSPEQASAETGEDAASDLPANIPVQSSNTTEESFVYGWDC